LKTTIEETGIFPCFFFLLTIARGAIIYHVHLEIRVKKKYYIGVKGKGKDKKKAPSKNKKY